MGATGGFPAEAGEAGGRRGSVLALFSAVPEPNSGGRRWHPGRAPASFSTARPEFLLLTAATKKQALFLKDEAL